MRTRNTTTFVALDAHHWEPVGAPIARRERTFRVHVYALYLAAARDGRRQARARVQHLDDYWGGMAYVDHIFTEQTDGSVLVQNTGDNQREVITDTHRYGAQLDETWVRAYLGEHHTVPPVDPANSPSKVLLSLMASDSTISAEAYHWVDDCFGVDEDSSTAIMSASPDRIVRTIERCYDGGVSEFLAATAMLRETGTPA